MYYISIKKKKVSKYNLPSAPVASNLLPKTTLNVNDPSSPSIINFVVSKKKNKKQQIVLKPIYSSLRSES